ncbi:hypothetical protein EOM86_04745 [Candidatus Nomurabacteria bacterium]|nr:hypothetical protein [Candidatus Nomurabacteria bacterium]
MELSLLDIVHILLKKIWIILISAAVGLVSALIITIFLITPEYTSRSQLYVNPNQSNIDQTGTYTELQYAQKLVNSYLIILQNDLFLEQVAQDSGLDYTTGQIRSMLSLSAINNTEIFEVKISAPEPQHAQTLVNTIVALAPEEILRIRELDTVKVVTPATLPKSPSSPNRMMNTAIGAILGFLIASAVVLLIEILDTRIKSEEDLTEHYQLPIIGSIPKYEDQ